MSTEQFRFRGRDEAEEWSAWLDRYVDGQDQVEYPDDDEHLEYQHRHVEKDEKYGDVIEVVSHDWGRKIYADPPIPDIPVRVPLRRGVGGPKIGTATVAPDGTVKAEVTDATVAAQLRPGSWRGSFSTGEVRVTDPKTGGQKGDKPEHVGDLDPEALLVLATVAGIGASKYSPHNYLRGYAWSLSFNAMMRHALAFWAGEDLDPETGQPHAAHAAWHGLALTSFLVRQIGTDDRPPKKDV